MVKNDERELEIIETIKQRQKYLDTTGVIFIAVIVLMGLLILVEFDYSWNTLWTILILLTLGVIGVCWAGLRLIQHVEQMERRLTHESFEYHSHRDKQDRSKS